MRIDKNDFNRNLSQSVVDQKINQLLVNVSHFSEIGCLDGKMFGVTTFCDSCDQQFNACVRNHLIEMLYASQLLMEKKLGYAITPQYKEKEFDWNGESLVILEPGLEEINIVETVTLYDTFPISPYIETDIEVNSSGDLCIAEVDSLFTKNPNEVWIRRESGHLISKTEGLFGYPKKIDGYWQIPVENVCGDEDVFNAQHCKYMYCDIDEPESGPDPLPCYPNSNQIIPTVKIEETEEGLRYWFYVWDLVDDAFADDEIDLEQGEFYKLLTEIDFKQFSSAASLPVVTVWSANNDCEVEFTVGDLDLNVSITNAAKGIIFVEYGPHCCQPILDCCNTKTPFKIRIKYKVNPEYLPFEPNYMYAEKAIAYHAASDLPLTVCNCQVTKGFIFEAQAKFDDIKINPATGDTYSVKRDPTIYQLGKIVFHDAINKMEKLQRYVKA